MKKSTKTLLFSFLLAMTNMVVVVTAQNKTTRVNVGVVLDHDEPVGRMGLRCIRMAISEFYASSEGRSYNTRIVVHSRDSNSDVVGAASSALDLIKNAKVQAIIGPLKSSQASFVVDLGEKAKVPIISFSATCSSLTTRSSYFFRATGNEASQAEAIASLVRASGWKQVVPIYTSDAYGESLVPFLVDALFRYGAHVPYRTAIDSSASKETLREKLQGLKAKTVRVFVVQAHPTLGKRIFYEAERLGMMREGFVWIVTSVMANLLNTSSMGFGKSMNGVLGIRSYVPRTDEVEDFRDRYRKRQFQDDDQEVNVFGLWAYDAAKALAMAVERTWESDAINEDDEKFRVVKKRNNNNSNDLGSIGVSLNGPKLRETLTNVRFKGLAGNFSLVHEELHVSAYEIVNVVNVGVVNVVGFWKPKSGLIRDLNSSPQKNNPHLFSLKEISSSITWPGGTNEYPKGWEIPINNNKLKIGVPVRGGFKEFVNVEYHSDNTFNVTGYCIDIFEEVMNSLPYKVEYTLEPYANSSRESNGTYDEMVYQVFLGNFDAVIGDVTIRSNRSLYVDFTLPYTESGVSMIVTVKDERNKNAWVFMKPLTWDLWATIVCFFVFIGFVVWVHEHRINKDFRGSPSHQIGTSLWFSFSTMVFATRERVLSNSSRFVIIIWVFVVLILTQSYTASLTSLLTVQQLKPTITNIRTLIDRSEYVGYLEASFTYEMLKSLGLKENQLIEYKSAEDLARAFSKNEIVAAFDEKPYMDVFLNTYCSKYTMIGPTFKTLGFGYAFPRGSPLVSDVSLAILNVTERGISKKIEEYWFKKKKNCQTLGSRDTSSNLGLESFWGLFLITTAASLFALTLHGVIFFHGNWDVIKSSIPPEASVWEKILVVFRVFDQNDLRSHASKKTANHQTSELRSNFFTTRDSSFVVPIDEATSSENPNQVVS